MKLLSALSVYTVFGLQVFLVISKINMEFLNPLYRKTLVFDVTVANVVVNSMVNNKRKKCLKTAFISFVIIMVASQNEFAFNNDVNSKEA